MASLAGTLTFLTLSGLSGPEVYVPQGETLTVRPTNLEFTELGLYGGPKFLASEFTAKATAPQQDWVLSDTAYLTATEGPIDVNEIVTYDTASLRAILEQASLLNYYAVTETARLSAGESVSLVTSGVTPKVVTDTASISATDVATLDVTLDVTDTASITGTEDPGTVDVNSEAFAVTDDAAITVDEGAAVNQFSGFDPIVVGDIVYLSAIDTATASVSRKVASIAIRYRMPKIVFRKL